jgi:hypothetical protein
MPPRKTSSGLSPKVDACIKKCMKSRKTPSKRKSTKKRNSRKRRKSRSKGKSKSPKSRKGSKRRKSPKSRKGRKSRSKSPPRRKSPKRQSKKSPRSKSPGALARAYCVKCKSKRMMQDLVLAHAKNGKPMAKGHCPECDTGMNKFLSEDDFNRLANGM